ncbi:phosphonopyruvate decarboxylase isoform X1 [Hydra vulgaris]|uniref:phosphonopyruvate decarboxylase isoform X1 n=1 Tax=Hydra vulgaris TaxID=6087 RepID=UPI000641881D|nr:phosphonopyruvate decarboxylase isoform X1 [Hydra vulgaris]
MALRSIFFFRSVGNQINAVKVIERFLSLSASNSYKEGQDQLSIQKSRNDDAGSYTELVRDFLDPSEFHRAVRKQGISFFTGVPDSLLKDYCAYVTANEAEGSHVISANEGSAVALAAGYHFATGRTALVYLQNSGLGNIVNPMMSLATPSVYSVPMLLLLGWRGEPGKRDEPQHVTMGQATPGILAACGIPFQILPDYLEGAEQVLYSARKHMEVSKGPYCLLVKRQTFLPYKMKYPPSIFEEMPLNREGAIEEIVKCLHDRDVVVGTTGMLSRELFEIREKQFNGHEKDFLTVGSMGHASAIALGIALKKPKRQVFCLDGDGACIMHMGNMSTIGNCSLPNYNHIVINNGAHDSVGGQPTDALNNERFNICQVALGLGYKKATSVSTPEEIRESVLAMRSMQGPVLLEIKVKKGSRKDLGRPTRTPIQNKADFMHFLAID